MDEGWQEGRWRGCGAVNDNGRGIEKDNGRRVKGKEEEGKRESM